MDETATTSMARFAEEEEWRRSSEETLATTMA
jgi:hypothetical protein